MKTWAQEQAAKYERKYGFAGGGVHNVVWHTPKGRRKLKTRCMPRFPKVRKKPGDWPGVDIDAVHKR